MPESLSHEMFTQLNRSPALARQLVRTAHRVQAIAKRTSAAAGGTATFTVDYGIRPGGRARVNVVSNNPGEEYGAEGVARIGALRRAAQIVNRGRQR